MYYDIKVVFGRNKECPKLLSGAWKTEGSPAAAYAKDAQTAGFFTDSEEGLCHYITHDSGVTWETHNVPFIISDSEEMPLLLRPVNLCHNDDTLKLLIYGVCNVREIEIEDEFGIKRRKKCVDDLRKDGNYFVLTSNDLGKTWSEPALISPQPRFPKHAQSIINYAQGTYFVAYETLMKIGAPVASSKDIGVTISALEDQSNTWHNQYNIFPEVGVFRPTIGGDGHVMHIALIACSKPLDVYDVQALNLPPTTKKKEINNAPYLVIRSFTTGNWTAPQEPLPADLKQMFQKENNN